MKCSNGDDKVPPGNAITRREDTVEIAVKGIAGDILDTRVTGARIDLDEVAASTNRVALVEDHPHDLRRGWGGARRDQD